MKITRITRIRGYRIFHDFTWPTNLPAFARFNLVYGWNGSGKTTLSSLLHHLQIHEPIIEGEAQFEIDGQPVAGNALATAPVPAVHVFDHDFIERTVVAAGSTLAPIYFLGQDSVDKQRQLEDLRQTLAHVRADCDTARPKAEAATQALAGC